MILEGVCVDEKATKKRSKNDDLPILQQNTARPTTTFRMGLAPVLPTRGRCSPDRQDKPEGMKVVSHHFFAQRPAQSIQLLLRGDIQLYQERLSQSAPG